MKAIEVATMEASLATALRQLLREAVILTEEGVPVAVLLPVENADAETISLSLNPRFLEIIERSRASLEREGGLSPEEVRRRLGILPPKGEKPGTPRHKRKANRRNKD